MATKSGSEFLPSTDDFEVAANGKTATATNGSSHQRAIPPLTGFDLQARTETAFARAHARADRHGVMAGRWQVVDTWARLAVALAASLSAVSLFAENATITAVFAITTAVASALNAAWDPARRSAGHRRATRDFRRIETLLAALVQAVYTLRQTIYVPIPTPEQGRYEQAEPSEPQLKELSAALIEYEERLELADDAAPALNRLTTFERQATPRTRLGLWRLRHRYELEDGAEKIRYEFHRPVPGPIPDNMK